MLCTLLSIGTAHSQCTAVSTNTAGTNGNSTGIGTVGWANTGATSAIDGSYASATSLISLGLLPITVTSNYLTLNNFGFSIPTTYTVCGVGVAINRGYGALLALNGNVADHTVQLANITGGTVSLLGTNQASGAGWPFGSTLTANYGGSGNLMGAGSFLPGTINTSNFGVAIAANLTTQVLSISVGISAAVDMVSMTVYATPPGTLPITLESFSVTGGSAGNQITWNAGVSGIANQFVIQRSADGIHWQDLNTISAAIGKDNYSYTDASPLEGINYYRLELDNTGGAVGYSMVAAVSNKSIASIHFYPNPFHDMINITAPGSFTHLSLKDVAGRTIWVKEYPGGVNSAQIPASQLPQGLYFVSVDGSTYKLIKN